MRGVFLGFSELSEASPWLMEFTGEGSGEKLGTFAEKCSTFVGKRTTFCRLWTTCAELL